MATRTNDIDNDTWSFRASLASEDQWETQFAATINAATGAEIELPDPLGLWELKPQPVRERKPPSTYERAVARAILRVQAAADEFLCRMDARVQRDRWRLREYYGALLREADPKKLRGGVNLLR